MDKPYIVEGKTYSSLQPKRSNITKKLLRPVAVFVNGYYKKRKERRMDLEILNPDFVLDFTERSERMFQSIRSPCSSLGPILARFCSRAILEQYALKYQEYSIRCEVRSISGCCFLADISGFTKLSSKLCNDGRGGLDRLRLIAGDYLGGMVDIIYSYGGDGTINGFF
jgi:hypothetical protein